VGDSVGVSRRHTRSFWERLAAEVDKRGAVWPVAKRHGVRVRTLAWWRWKLKHDRAFVVRRPRLLPVVVAGEPAMGTRASQVLELAIRDVRMRIESGTDVHDVAALVGAVRQC
jgi:hypothetical protein